MISIMSAGSYQISRLAWFLSRPSNPHYFYVLLAIGWLTVDFFLWKWGVTLQNEYRIGKDIWSITLAGESSVFILVPAVAIMGVNLAVRGAVKDWSSLTQSAPEPSEGIAQKMFGISTGSVLTWSLIGCLLATSHLLVSGDLQSLFLNMVPAKAFLLAHIYFEWILFVQISGLFIQICNGFNRLGKSITPNLVQQQTLAPFSNVGLRMIATLVGIFISTLLLMDFNFVFFLVPFAVILVVSLIIFILPQLGVRMRIKRIKRETMNNLEEKILAVGLPGTAMGTKADTRQNVAELITVRNMVAAYPDWPISSSNAIRLGFYLFLPLFSWGVNYLLGHYFG